MHVNSPGAGVAGVPGSGASSAGARVASPIPDVQGQPDARRVAIEKVGVKGVVFPMRVRVAPAHRAHWDGGAQHTIATFDMYVSLPHAQKGTHMSRFVEVLNDHQQPIGPGELPALARAVRTRLAAPDAFIECSFTYFIKKFAPVTGAPGMIDLHVTLQAAVHADGREEFVLGVKAPATSLCPCSKEISAYGAHNQRCLIEARVRPASTGEQASGSNASADAVLWIEDLASILEQAASTQVYAVLKRPDEKHVTEAAYDNPKFVEDIIRDLALAMEREPRVAWYAINSENFESIHNHNAYAQITRDKRATT
jgi:GTP cyclohydrolase I